MFNWGVKSISPSVVAGESSSNGNENQSRYQTAYNTRSSTAHTSASTPESSTNEKKSSNLPTKVSSKQIKKIKTNAKNSFEKIQLEYSRLVKKFWNIPNNSESKPMYLELIEELNQIVFTLDKVDVGNLKELKDERRELLKLVQSLIRQAREKVEDGIKKEQADTEEGADVDIFEDVFMLGSSSHSNLVYDPQANVQVKVEKRMSADIIDEPPCKRPNVEQLGGAGDDDEMGAVKVKQEGPEDLFEDTNSFLMDCFDSHTQENQEMSALENFTLDSNHAQSNNQERESNNTTQQLAPIQLLIHDAEGLFELDEAAIKSVLCGGDVKNRKIAIVSVVGAFRRGKSFLLNFMLRCLRAQGHPDWLQQSDELEGFSWRGGRERETAGILMWPEAFLIGDDKALILLDTQGTSMKENTLIFALSTLVSSVQIYNLHERIEMDDLTKLQYFLEFGRMVQTSCNDKVFENLIFLIRDWKFETKNGYGFEGGNLELEEWFKKNSNEEQAEMLQTCFKQVLCFLMPHPGEEVSRNINFRGALKDIEPEFLNQLKIFIETVLHPDKLALKQIGGQCVRAQDLPSYMKNYVERLQHPNLEPKTLFQSMSETCREKAMGEAKQVYMTEMEAGLKDITVDIQALHQTAQQSACQLFDKAPKFGLSNYDTASYRKKLVECFKELYNRYDREFECNKESQFHTSCCDIYDTYQNTLTIFCMQLQHECTLEEKCKEAYKHAIDSLDNLKFKVPQQLMSSKVLELKKKMQQFYLQHVPYFKARQHIQASTTKEQYAEVKQNVVKCYQQTMDKFCSGSEPATNFNTLHGKAEFSALKLMHADIEKYQLSDCNQMQMEINKEISELCKRYKNHNQNQIEEKKKEDNFLLVMLECRQAVIDKYRGLMDDKCGGLKTVENIELIHEKCLNEVLNLFDPHTKTYGDISKNIKDTKKYIEDLYIQYKNYNEEKQKHNVQERAGQLQTTAFHFYEKQLELLHIGTNPIEDLQSAHAKIWDDAVKMLDPIRYTDYYDESYDTLNENVQQRITYYTQLNNNRLQQAKQERMKAKLDESVKYYQDKMDGLHIDVHPVDHLEVEHSVYLNEAMSMLDEFSNMEDYAALVSQLEEEAQKKKQVYHEKNEKMHELFQNDQKRSVMQAHNNMKTKYTTNMLKQMCAAVDTKDSSLLYTEHQKWKEECLENFRELTSECNREYRQEYLEKLTHDIQTSYEEVEETYAKNRRDLRVKEEALRQRASKTYAIGIDLGTTNCCAAVYRNGDVEIIVNSIEKTTTPSVVCFKDHEIVFGETAVVAGVAYPENCISEMKRIIGRRFEDPVVQARLQKWHFKIINAGGMPAVQLTNGSKVIYKPEDISALVLGEMKRIAEVYLGSKVHDAVVTIPAYFNELQREATKVACVKAGLNVLRMINEPTAAAIAYGLQCKSDEFRKVLVFDFGGGTCDVSIMTIQGKTFTVKASKGDNVLGGEDFDDRLTDHVSVLIERKYKIKIGNSGRRRLRIACETAKKRLSSKPEYRMNLDEFQYNEDKDSIDVDVVILKKRFKNLTKDLVLRALEPVNECLLEANMKTEDIDEVIMVGGSSKMPTIKKMLKTFFERKELNIRINPDEAIAYGAAIQAAVSCGELKDYIINEITPMSLGANLVDNRMGIITPKNSRIPCSHTTRRFTIKDYQKSILFTLYQGECEEDEFQNTRIGEFVIRGIKRAPAGKTQVDVTFKIDADGILHVSAVEVGNHRNKVQLTVDKKVV